MSQETPATRPQVITKQEYGNGTTLFPLTKNDTKATEERNEHQKPLLPKDDSNSESKDKVTDEKRLKCRRDYLCDNLEATEVIVKLRTKSVITDFNAQQIKVSRCIQYFSCFLFSGEGNALREK